MSPLVDGAAFILDAPIAVPAVWGTGDEVLWSEGEALLIVGPSGIGKSTLAQQIVRGRIIGGLNVASYSVKPGAGRVLYIAADRPAQIQRSMRRIFADVDRKLLTERLIVWRGALPFSLAAQPKRLLAMAQHCEADTVVIDSLKDVASPLSDEKVGAAIAEMYGHLTEAGVELVVNHHQRKAQENNRRPMKLDDVYGSNHITNSAGSVVLLWGQPGDAVVEMRHLKQPSEEVGPHTLVHDHTTGTTTIQERVTAYDLVHDGTGVTVKDAAKRIYSTATPTRNEIEKARRKLDQLVKEGHARKREGGHEKDPAIYIAVKQRDTPREASRDHHANGTNPANTDHAPITGYHAPSEDHGSPLKGGPGPHRDTQREALTTIEATA